MFKGHFLDHHLSLLYQVKEFVRAGEIFFGGGVVGTSMDWDIILPTFSYN